ncbi:MAG: tripartite tricarboxylate transporter substrate binding protein [Pseudomonadota bacterium]
MPHDFDSSSFHATRRALLQAAAIAAAGFSGAAAHAQGAFPTKPIKVYVPFPPGGTTDYVTRIVTTEMGKTLGQPVVIENKPGASTVIGIDAAAKAPPDGYTLACVSGSFCVNRTLIKKLPYDNVRDLRPVGLMGVSEHALVAHPDANLKSLADLVKLAKAKPGTLSYASFGNGSTPNLSGEMLKAQMGIDLLHVPYKGQAPALTDLLGGQVNVMFGSWLDVRDYIKAGRLTCLGMASLKRSPFAPEIPSLAEQGAPIESNTWAGLVAPAATPDAVVARLNAEINKALALRSTIDSFAKNSVTPLPGTQEQFAAYMRSEVARFADIIQKAHITAEM